MKILIVTQIIDKNDPFLGFFHYWVEAFSKQFEHIHVICLKKGAHNLPSNVTVHSLGKEEGVSRFIYVTRLFTYAWGYRKEYDSVYVHMNQEYVLLVGWLWRLMGKKVTLWRNHFAGSLVTDIASLFCNKVFCTSKFSYTAKYKKTVFMPVGVSTEMFTPDQSVTRVSYSILSFVRISPAKKIEQLIEALRILKEKNIEFTTTICGDATEQHKEYEATLHTQVESAGLQNRVVFRKGIPFEKVPALYTEHDISVNQSPSGMYDKTIFEAMLCDTLALSCNENLSGAIDEMFLFKEDDIKGLADKLEKLLTLPDKERVQKARELREYAKNTHSLSRLAERLKEELS